MKRALIGKFCVAAAILGMALAPLASAVTVGYNVDGVGPVLFPGPVTPPPAAPNLLNGRGYAGDKVEFQAFAGTLDLTPGTSVKKIGTLLWSIDYTYAGTPTCWDYPDCWTDPLLHVVSAPRSMTVGSASGALAQTGLLENGWDNDFLSFAAGTTTDFTVSGYLVHVTPQAVVRTGGSNYDGAPDGNPWVQPSLDVMAQFVVELAPPTVTPQPPVSCITPAHPCVAVPVTIARGTPDNVRGFSIDVTLSANLTLCGANISQGTFLSGANPLTNFQVVSNGAGNYTVDGAILGSPCGATALTGTLFTINVASSSPSGTGTVTVNSVTLRDCNNVSIAAVPGPGASVTIQNTAPAAITNLSATQKLSGNGAVSTTGVLLTWSTGGAGAVSLYRAPFGSYPEYDDDGAVTPPVAATAPGGPWVLVNSNATSPYNDAAAARGYWYYVAFVTDACGNVSAVSNMTGGTLNYLLGDVTPALGAGDNKVDGLDISALGASYGISGEGLVDAVGYLDVGPTLTGAANARPKPDDKINFEDLMIFSINYGGTGLQVVEPGAGPVADADAITVSAPAKVSGGGTFTVELRMKGAGDIQGVTSQLAWDAGVAAPVSVTAGDLVTAANGVAFSAQPGNVDVALLGSRHHGLSGDGVLAVVTFRALTSGDPKVSLARVEARDASNRPVTLSGVPQGAATPGETTLFPVTPNPFRKDAVLGFSLAKDGPVELAIYSVDGRRVTTVAAGTRSAGVYRLSWNGTDANGAQVGAGMYYARLTVGGVKLTRRLVYIK